MDIPKLKNDNLITSNKVTVAIHSDNIENINDKTGHNKTVFDHGVGHYIDKNECNIENWKSNLCQRRQGKINHLDIG